MKIKFTNHALEEMRRRGIEKDIVDKIVQTPGQKLQSESNRMVYQDLIEF